ncbi:MAG: DNA-binding protein [Crocosphaera sp.]
MPKSLTTSEPNILRPEDFDPPLKRKEPSLPGYWTLEEIATELNISSRRVGYDITGYPKKNIEPNLKAFKVGRILFISDENALEYIKRYRERKKS